MSNDNSQSRKRRRWLRLSGILALMGLSFMAGGTLALILAFRLLLPIAATGMTLGLVGIASASSNALITALVNGDSEVRLTALTQLEELLDAQPKQTFDPQAAVWLLPAIGQCKEDKDPRVVELAESLTSRLEEVSAPVQHESAAQ